MFFDDSLIQYHLKNKIQQSSAAGKYHLEQQMVICDGACRADMALFTGDETHGFAIKSDRDSLAHLGRQIEHLGRFFDRLTIVTGHHWGEVSARTPPWVGVLMATQDENGEFCWVRARAGGRSPHTDPRLAAQVLWRSYLQERLTALQGQPPPASWCRARLADHLITLCGADGARCEVLKFLHWRRTAPPISLTGWDVR